MTNLERFLDYARTFEVAYLSNNFDLIARFFADDAKHLVPGCKPLAIDDRGRDAVVGGLRDSVYLMDRRFDARIAEVLEGPEVREDGIWMKFGLRLRRAGLPDLEIQGEHLTQYNEAGLIVRIDEKLLDESDEHAREYLEKHDDALRATASPFALPNAEDTRLIEQAVRRTMVRAYAAAKSRQDIAAALSVCHPDFVIETISLGTASDNRESTAGQLGIFFHVFPDYRAETEGLAMGDETIAWWGKVSMTFANEFLGIAPTGKRAKIPAFCTFDFKDGLLSRERFFFDLCMLADGIGVSAAELSAAVSDLRQAAA